MMTTLSARAARTAAASARTVLAAGGSARAARTAGGSARTAAVLALTAAGAIALAACGPASPAASPAASPSRATAATSAAPVPPAATTSGPAGPAQPGGFQVMSMSFVSDQRGFALGSVGCGTGRCAALLGTTDGGATWAALAAPARAVPDMNGICPAGQPCVGQIRFATPLIGYAYDPYFYLTTDGGRHWRRAAGSVRSVEAADGTVVRVVADAIGCAGGPEQVDTAAPGSTAWSPLPAPHFITICPPVLYRQGQQLVLAGYGNPAGGVPASAQLSRSANGGRTWTATGPDACYSGQGYGKDGFASTVAVAPPAVLALLCRHQRVADGIELAWIRVSASNGASYGPDEAVPLVSSQPGAADFYQLAAASASRLLAVETDGGDDQNGSQLGGQVLLTVDGGVAWSTVLRLPAGPPALLVGFEDPLTGRVAQGDTVWTTRTGGRTWVADRF
jgi:photosystem II stability/assembly factor-like uncharacterized protein